MAIKVNNLTALGNYNDLIVPTATRQYPLGFEIEIEDTSTAALKKYVYVKAHDALTQYQPYVVTNSGTAGAEVKTGAPATLTSAVAKVCWPQVAFTSSYYGFVQTAGKLSSIIPTSTGLGAGAAYKLTNGASALASDSGTTQSISACAYLITNTTGTTGVMYAPGYRVTITT